MAEFLHRLGSRCARRARTVVLLWLAVLAAAAGSYVLFGGTLSNAFSIPGTETERVADHLAQSLPEASGGTGRIVLTTVDGEPFDAEQRELVAAAVTELGEVDGVSGVFDPFAAAAEAEAGFEDLDAAGLDPETQAALLEQGATLAELAEGAAVISEDGDAAIVTVSFDEAQLEVTAETKADVVAVFEDDPVENVEVDFSVDLVDAIPELAGMGEVVGLIVAGIALIVMLGTLVGAGLPLLTALVGVGVGALAAMSLSGVADMASVTPILGLMLGLAVGIDYALFIVNRHRRQLKAGHDLDESIALAAGTSGNAVVFAGATVFIALAALNVSGIPFLGLMGTVGALCIATAVLVAVTLVPALLKLAGLRVLRSSERVAREADPPHSSAMEQKTSATTSVPRALLRVFVGVGALLVVALPALDLRLNLPDGSSEAHDSTQYRAHAAVAEEFGEGMNGPLLVVADLPGGYGPAELLAVQVHVAENLAAHDDVVAVAPAGVSEDGSVAAFQAIPAEGPTSESTEELVHTLRELEIDGVEELGVAGAASGNIDISQKLADALPIYLTVVVGLSLLILILVFRSIFVPVVATLGFILSYFAALGGVVAIYQWGWLAEVFGVESPGPVLNFLPTLLAGILFGLAMDYMLFLGSGMREAYAHGVPARQAVVQGVRAGRAVVAAAAIIMISVFGGFVFSHSAMIRPIGFALAFGVLVDAFLVRMLIVPALMHLAGDKAWKLPRWLDRMLPDVDVEGAGLERRHPQRDRVGREEKETEPALG